MKAALIFLLWLAAVSWGDLDRYTHLVVSDVQNSGVPSSGIRVTYLGTNGYLLEADGTTLLIDPYFTRTPLLPVALNLRQSPSEADLAWARARLPQQVDAVLVTHGHFDHLLDVPPLAAATGAKVIASRTGAFLARAAGARELMAVRPGMRFKVKGASIRVLAASHDCLLGRIPFPGTRDAIPAPPQRPSDWVCGEPLAFLIEIAGHRIYLDSGGTRGVLPSAELGSVDLAIAGVALPDSRARLPELLTRLRPQYFLPSHQDHFFRPVQRGFVFGPLTDFQEVRRVSAGHRMILLDYFRPWTLR